jgi:cytochrome P450
MMEVHLILAAIVRSVDLTLPPDHPPVEMEPLFTLRPRNGLSLLVERRSAGVQQSRPNA